jgi:Autophagy-related protein 13
MVYTPNTGPLEAKPMHGRGASRPQDPSSVYKRMVVMLRSLCTYVRVLPAYRIHRACRVRRPRALGPGFHDLREHKHAALCIPAKHQAGAGAQGSRARVCGLQRERSVSSIRHRISTILPAERRLVGVMQRFSFSPIETPYGALQMAVDYSPSATVTLLEGMTSPAPLPQIIADYIGGGHEPPVGRLATAAPRSGGLSASLCERQPLRRPDPSSSPPITSGGPRDTQTL